MSKASSFMSRINAWRPERMRWGVRRRSLAFERMEDRVLLSADVRTINGIANNLAHDTWGAADTALIRMAPAAYPPDGSGDTMVGESMDAPFWRANPRDISNAIVSQTESIVNDRGLSDWVWQWGQFLDHDLDLTTSGASHGTAPMTMNEPADPMGPGPMPFDRSEYDPLTGSSAANPRQQINHNTSFIDASNVYGSDAVRAAELRLGVGGRLKTSDNNLLPFNTGGLPNGGGPDPGLFLAGDIRANEQICLTAVHTLFVREHNRLAELLAQRHPQWTDELLYQAARRIVSAEMQIITYNEFLPALLGPSAPRAIDFAYDPAVNPSVANEFSTAFYRFGHSMLSPELLLVGKNAKVVGTLRLREAFFNANFLIDSPAHVDHLLAGLAQQRAQEVDNKIVDDVRNFLFGPPGAGGLDLASLNIQRGRDHGLPDYNTLRAVYGLERVENFAQISSDAAVRATLEALYGNVDNVDAWVGGLAEDHLPGSSLGALATAALVDQFTRLRDGDRFFYAGEVAALSASGLAGIFNPAKVTLAQIIRDNTGVGNIPQNVFFVQPIARPLPHPGPHVPTNGLSVDSGGPIFLFDDVTHDSPVPIPRRQPELESTNAPTDEILARLIEKPVNTVSTNTPATAVTLGAAAVPADEPLAVILTEWAASAPWTSSVPSVKRHAPPREAIWSSYSDVPSTSFKAEITAIGR
jgi:hypothetical protein